MDQVYYIFGSASSLDLDLLVIVDTLPSIEESKKLCVKLDQVYRNISDKKINVNIATLQDQALSGVFKGTLDEVNNSILDTYHLHKQEYQLFISKRIKRDKEAKVLRSIRAIVSFLSRSQHREKVKEALKGDLIARIEALEQIDLSIPVVCSKYPLADIYKTIAFQIGQCQSLLNDKELFTKENIAENHPLLNDFIWRKENPNLQDLEKAKTLFIKEVKNYLPQMKRLRE